ncbi:MAG: glycolate oxidase subunit GlcE [Rhodoferax sp.]|nr:glycolate oxidase subunit GlcE [Rhodoferax sp.]OIP21178.1 MAG: glycolate oxidase subunit GlcE [Comamonadaceae bacterium CG2_30_60_41]PIW09549.1 MAG: glycolate oxidase subunit GlcE [Comamonadaceae bacterium CG17_big_fil_post_rev_8_21_14_2_50_60_13]PIY23929.1 MAG: glycolate oxidase subunit GlcE [Comamonadaceae bacterium CG_4_10_14_3_um_filter_60_75]PJC11823.1 MAG: glycolate oxidase subunit GlcE [Comamonadaceae bacterium CG_4_9_14_0_8_um_filter_60_18]
MDTALQQLTDQIRAAATDKTPLTLCGHGSKAFYGNPTPAGTLLDATAYRGIVSYEPTELVITVRAGTPLVELEAALAEKGQCLAFEPPRFVTPGAAGLGTCGGMVAGGLSGPARASVGSVRDFVLGATLINGRGEHLVFGGQVMKNVAGYDISRLMAGTLGTLGLLTNISLKVLPQAPAEATLVFQLDQASALAQLHRWGGQPLPLSASCWVRDNRAVGAPELLFVRLRGAVAAVASAVQKMTQDAAGQRVDNGQAMADWAACRDQRLSFFTEPASTGQALALWRLSLPQTAPALNLPWPQLIEWHGAQRWLWAPVLAQTQIQQAARQAGGSAGIFRAVDATGTGAKERFDTLDPTLLAIHQRLKNEFDPAGIFNPGRLYSTF